MIMIAQPTNFRAASSALRDTILDDAPYARTPT
jgi:hypothetical protein